MSTDWRETWVLDAETSEALLGIMRSKNDRIERQVLLTDPSAVIGLQVARPFQEGGGEARAIFDSVHTLRDWMEPALTAPKAAALRVSSR
jgi:hypothetical protein